MTTGLIVPLDRDFIKDLIARKPQFLRKNLQQLTDDRHFAEAIYRYALADGLMNQVTYKDAVAETG